MRSNISPSSPLASTFPLRPRLVSNSPTRSNTVALHGHVRAERRLARLGDRVVVGAVGANREKPVESLGKPRRGRRLPDRRDESSARVRPIPFEALQRRVQPIRFGQHIVVGEEQDVASRNGDSVIAGMGQALRRLELIAQRGPLALRLLHDTARMIFRVVVDDDDLPRAEAQRSAGRAMRAACPEATRRD